MGKTTAAALAVCMCLGLFVSCGPKTIYLKKGFDTPSHHVDNGYKLMGLGKLYAAQSEFERARELDDRYAPAYVGLGIAHGMQGNLEKGRAIMETARTLAADEEQRKEVELGFERLYYLEKEWAE